MEPIIIPSNIYSDLKKAIDSQKNELEFVPTPESFSNWFENEYDPYENDDLSNSWELADELIVWNIYESLENQLDEIIYELGDAYQSRSKPEILNELIYFIEELDPDYGGNPGIHIFPTIIDEKTWFIIGIYEFGQGGAYPTCIGIFESPKNAINYLKSDGWYSIYEKPDSKTIENWFLNQKN